MVLLLPRATHVEGRLNRLCEARHERCKPGNEGSKCAPVESIIVPVDSFSIVKLVDIQFALLDDVVIADYDTGKRAHEARISAQEC